MNFIGVGEGDENCWGFIEGIFEGEIKMNIKREARRLLFSVCMGTMVKRNSKTQNPNSKSKALSQIPSIKFKKG